MKEMAIAEVTPLTPPQTPALDRKGQEQRALDILSGKLAPSSPTVGYFLERVKDTRAERDLLASKMKQLDEQFTQLRKRKEDLEAQSNAYVEDLIVWDKKALDAPVEWK